MKIHEAQNKGPVYRLLFKVHHLFLCMHVSLCVCMCELCVCMCVCACVSYVSVYVCVREGQKRALDPLETEFRLS